MKMTYGEARARAVIRELEANSEILLLGSAIAHPFNPDIGLDERYPDRIIWPPIAEFATLSIATGAAMAGLRTLVPIGTSTFMYYGWSAIVQEAANVRYLSGGQTTAPVAFHIQSGFRRGSGAQHEHTPQSMLQNIPGLVIYAPGTPAEVDGAFHAALTGEDPTLIVDHVLLVDAEGDVPDAPVPPDYPTLVREGDDALMVASSLMVARALDAASQLAAEGVQAGVLSVPRLSPAPEERVLDVASRYAHVLFVDESRGPASPSSYLMARLSESGASSRLGLTCTGPAPSPAATHLLDELVPTVDRIAGDVKRLLGEHGDVIRRSSVAS